MEEKAKQLVEKIINETQTALFIPFDDDSDYRSEYLDQLLTGDCNCLLSFLKNNGFTELSAEVEKYLK